MAIRSPKLPLSQTEIDYVADLVEKAGGKAVSMRNGVEISHKSSPEDKVTAADLAISTLLCEGLAKKFPSDAIISEEDASHVFDAVNPRLWLIDPIDGTQNYIAGDGEYCVMVGLLVNLEASFGWIYAPHTGLSYYGGPNYGAFRRQGKTVKAFDRLPPLTLSEPARVVMGARDRRVNPWIKELSNVTLLKTGSIGLKVARILEGEADLFAHLGGKLKTWDTAGPAALALGAGMDVGQLDCEKLLFPLPEIKQETSVIMGRKGALEWCREHLREPYAK